jgi:pimeloyl-ACP methyl ester carboxylesterase
VSDHMSVHGLTADAVAARLDTAEKRRDYVKSFYTGPRQWRPDGPLLSIVGAKNFSEKAASFLAQPFENADVFRASLRFYEVFANPKLASELSFLSQRNTETETLVMWGVEEQITGANFNRRAEIAYEKIVGPFLIERAGHFLSWERPEVFNRAIECFCRDLLQQRKR